MRAKLPTADDLLPYLRRVDEARYYSNHGELLRELQSRLAALFSVKPHQVAVVANGTVALSAALLAVGAPAGSRCLLPSWTFVASASAAWAASLRPHFVDVSDDTWALDPKRLLEREDLDDVGAVVVVSPFGAPVQTAAWDDFTRRTGIPVVIDAAAGFDTVARVEPARPGRSPVMISLHATKAFGVGEGGLVLCTDDEVIQRFHQICNFGIWNHPEGQILGYNGKLSEYHAAVGLAGLDDWENRRLQLCELTGKYREALAGHPALLTLSPEYGNGWVSCYCNVRLAEPAAAVIRDLNARGISTRRWWQSGVHAQHAYRNLSRDALPVTDALGDRVFGVPFFHDITDAEFSRVVEALDDALSVRRTA